MIKKKDITKIENLSFLENNKVINNPLRPLINPDDLPYADFDIYDERTFLDLFMERSTDVWIMN